eukprot:TRINITY_DN8003_c0_g1_i1.p1 TRINITY_DN8003_c0_g1~~TRINITY_DN8003_c0_g1_i1.p1  ORF type:complete len:248 (+),score=7.19 TRINITY_DN8003_c0_g1_i1:23-745(+)
MEPAVRAGIKQLFDRCNRDVLATLCQVVEVLNEEEADVGLSLGQDVIHILDLRSEQFRMLLPRQQCLSELLRRNNDTQGASAVLPAPDTLPPSLVGPDVHIDSPTPTVGTVIIPGLGTRCLIGTMEGSDVMPTNAWGARGLDHPALQPKEDLSDLPPSHRSTLTQHSPRLPRSTKPVDPTTKAPSARSQGGYTTTKPYYQQYGYYRTYGGRGQGALSSAVHNFPTGAPPHPSTVYSTGPT